MIVGIPLEKATSSPNLLKLYSMEYRPMILLSLLSFLFFFNIKAEYRVYQYYVASRNGPPSAHLVTSTLDPISYLSYHGGEESIRIDLLRSWICKGYTGERTPLCQSPLGVYLKSIIERPPLK